MIARWPVADFTLSLISCCFSRRRWGRLGDPRNRKRMIPTNGIMKMRMSQPSAAVGFRRYPTVPNATMRTIASITSNVIATQPGNCA